MNNVKIREMQFEDLEAVVNLYAEVFSGKYIGFGELAAGMGKAPGVPSENASALFREELKVLLNDKMTSGLFVADHNNEVIGFAVAILQHKEAGLECWLNDLGVHRNCQGQGVGPQLVEKVLSWAFQIKGANYCLLESGTNNEIAHKLFERMGFQALSTVFWTNAYPFKGGDISG